MADLFESYPLQILSHDGEAVYYGAIFEIAEARSLFDALHAQTPWKHDEVVMFGKKIVTKRKMAWYADNGLAYTYASSRKEALPWTPLLLKIREQVARLSGHTYNSCLLNLYHNGGEAMGWHADNEKELQKGGAIASLSLGARRKFAFKHRKDASRVDVWLDNGSLLVMKGALQEHWLHRLPPTQKVGEPRINLTFRTIKPL